MSIFDKAREKALKKLSEEDEEVLDEDDVLEEGAEDAPSTTDEDIGGSPPTAGVGGATDDGEVPAEGEALEEEPTDDTAGASPRPTEADGVPEEGDLPAEGDVLKEEPVEDGVPEEGDLPAAGEGVEDTSSTTDGVGGPSSGGRALDGAPDTSIASDGDASYTGEANMEEDSAGTDEGPFNEREQRLASEITRLQRIADQAAAQVAELQAQLGDANARLDQVSSSAEEAIEGAAVSSGPPIFDHAAYRMMDEAAAEEYAAEHDRKMSEYYSRRAEERYQPYIDEHDKAVRAEGRRGAIGRLLETGELPGIGESETDIFRILDEVPALQNDDSESAVAAAYLISVGLDAINSKEEGKEKTAAEIVAEIEANPEVMKLLAEKQAAALEENGKIPTFTRRASARSVPSAAPSTLNDAGERARKRFGL